MSDMKIDRDKRGFPNAALPINRGNIPVQRKAPAQFEQELGYQQTSNGKIRMQELLKEIDRVNNLLKQRMNLNNLMQFKKVVRDFLNEATHQAYQVQKDKTRNRRGRAMLITIQTINQEMEQLIEGFVTEQPDPVEVLTSLDKIRGMLVDLMI